MSEPELKSPPPADETAWSLAARRNAEECVRLRVALAARDREIGELRARVQELESRDIDAEGLRALSAKLDPRTALTPRSET